MVIWLEWVNLRLFESVWLRVQSNVPIRGDEKNEHSSCVQDNFNITHYWDPQINKYSYIITHDFASTQTSKQPSKTCKEII